MPPPDGGEAGGRWDRIQDLLAEALERPPADREAFLRERCPDDPAMLEEVASLIEASEASDLFFGDLADRAGMTLSDDTLAIVTPSGSGGHRRTRRDPELIGRRVGQYEVLEWLGRGGMASVFLAEREGDGFTQRVALKVVSRRVSDPLIQRRSNEERRILARLEHRGIARLIDGGVTPDGFPFYAMEYVEGTDVLSYCDDRKLTVDERIRLFLEVCAPVQFAHQRLVVHCDLKPSNIFVTPEGHVKLLDFGVARLIDPEAVGDEVTGLWFTPAYASPEQVRRERPGTHSDVYSLGVLLYEMLCGHRPYRFGTNLQEEIARTVGEQVPDPPSRMVTRPAVRRVGGARVEVPPFQVAAERSSTPGAMRKRLRGDLDAIVAKALAKDTDDRYATADALASDLRRHLAHEPVGPVASTPAYRVGKFVRRNRAAVTTAGVALLVLSLGVAATLWQASRATRAAEVAEAQAERAAVVAELMGDLFRLSDPTTTLGDTVTARDILDRGSERILAEFGDQPAMQADLLGEVARVYNNLGQYERAVPLVEQSLEIRSRQFGPTSLEASESLVHLGVLHFNLSEPAEAIQLLSRAVDIRGEKVEDGDPLLIEALSTLGWAVRSAGQYEQAADLFREALDIQTALDAASPEIASLKFGLAAAYHDDGLLDEADALFQEVLTGLDADARPTPSVVSALRRVGMVRRLREQYVEADPLLSAAVDMGGRLWGPSHGNTLSATQEYGLNLIGLGRWDEAEVVLRQGVETSVRALGPRHAVTARLQEGLGSVLEDLGRYDEAIDFQKLSLEEKVIRHENRDHAGVVASLVGVARTLALAGRHQEARDYVTQAEAMNLRLGQEPSVYAISSERTLGLIATAEGEFATAEAHFRRAVALADALLPRPTHRFRTGALTEYADLLVVAGRPGEAVGILEEVLTLQLESLPRPHPVIERTRTRLDRARASA